MADVKPEQRAELRKMRKSVMYVGDMSSGSQKVAALLDAILPLLDALDAAERELRQRELHHFETEQMLAAAEARVAAAEREALERAAQAIRESVEYPDEDQRVDDQTRRAWRAVGDAFARLIVRDLTPRKDGE